MLKCFFKLRSFISFFLIILLVAFLITVGTNISVSAKSSAASNKVDKVVFALITFNNIPDDYSFVEKAVNDVLRKKANVEIDLQLYGPSEYSQRVNLNLSSGAQMDLFLPDLGQFPYFVTKNAAYPLENLIKKYGQDLKKKLDEDFGPDWMKAVTMKGHVYAVPVNKAFAIPATWIYNADMLKETGISPDQVKSIEDLDKVFRAVKQKHPDVVPFGPINVNPSDTGLIWYLRCRYRIDFLTDSTGVGVLIGNSNKVVNLYETNEFKYGVKIMRDWYKKGYIQKDAATTTTGQPVLVSTGRGFSFMGGYSGKEIGKVFSAQWGKNIGSKRIAPPYTDYFDTRAVNQVVWMINKRSKVPEAAMKFLNILYTDKYILNTLLYGIEGTCYVKVDEHHVTFPKGKTAADVPYTAHLCSGVLGSESLQYQLGNVSWEDVLFRIKENKTTPRSPYFGFIFDPEKVRTEISTVNNVINRYLPALVCGSVDPDTTIPQFINALKRAGADKIIKEKQLQLNQWISENKKK